MGWKHRLLSKKGLQLAVTECFEGEMGETSLDSSFPNQTLFHYVALHSTLPSYQTTAAQVLFINRCTLHLLLVGGRG